MIWLEECWVCLWRNLSSAYCGWSVGWVGEKEKRRRRRRKEKDKAIKKKKN